MKDRSKSQKQDRQLSNLDLGHKLQSALKAILPDLQKAVKGKTVKLQKFSQVQDDICACDLGKGLCYYGYTPLHAKELELRFEIVLYPNDRPPAGHKQFIRMVVWGNLGLYEILHDMVLGFAQAASLSYESAFFSVPSFGPAALFGPAGIVISEKKLGEELKKGLCGFGTKIPGR